MSNEQRIVQKVSSAIKAKAVALFFVALAIVLLITYPFCIDTTLLPKAVALVALNLLVLLLTKGVSEISMHGRTLAWLGIGAGVFIGVGALGATAYSPMGTMQVLTLDLLTLLFCMQLLDKKLQTVVANIPRFLASINFLLAVLGTVQFGYVFLTEGMSHENTYLVSGFFGHRNLFGQLIAITLPFAVYELVVNKRTVRWVFLTGGVLSLFLIVSLLVRSVWVSMVVGALFTAFAFLWSGWKEFGFKRLKSTLLIGVVALSVISGSALIYAKMDGAQTFQRQVNDILNWDYSSTNDRLELWKSTAHLIKDNPAFGVGAGNWRVDVLEYGLGNSKAQDGQVFFQRAHNEYLQVTAERGVFGLLIMVLFLGYLLKIMIAKLRTKNPVWLAVLASLVIFLCAWMFSFPMERIPFRVVFGLLAVFLIADSTKSFKISWVSGLMIVVLLGSGALLIARISHEVAHKKALSSYPKVAALEALIERGYDLDPFTTPVSWYLGMEFLADEKLDQALDAFLKADEINPYHYHNLNNIGACYLKLGEAQKSIPYFKRAYQALPKLKEARVNLAQAYYLLKDYDRSYRFSRLLDQQLTPYQSRMLNTLLLHKLTAFEAVELTRYPNALKLMQESPLTMPWLKHRHYASIAAQHSIEKEFLNGLYVILKSNKNYVSLHQLELNSIQQRLD